MVFNKRMVNVRKIAIVVLLLVIALTFSMTVSAAVTNPVIVTSEQYTAVIDDSANLLSEYEEESLMSQMQACLEYANFAIVTTDTNYSYTTQRYAEQYNNNIFSSNGIVFVIDMSNRYLYLDSTGSARNYITNTNGNTITDNVYKYATDGDYYSCMCKVVEQVYALMRGAQIARPMKTIGNAFISIFLGFVISYLIARKTNKMHQSTVEEELAGANVAVAFDEPYVEFVSQSKTYDPVSSGSSGGGGHSGGGGGGGGHSGGGHGF